MTPEELHALAVETDTRLAEVHAAEQRAQSKADQAIDDLHRLMGHRKDRSLGWSAHPSIEDADVDSFDTWKRASWDRHMDTLLDARLRIRDLRAEAQGLHNTWLVHGCWSRFFLVKNSNGHIHKTMACQTCHVTTDFAWLPTLSGLTEADAVESQGEILCSVCFPTAPVAWTSGESKASVEAKTARAAAKAEREAKRLAKALMPDGEPLKVFIEVRNGYNRTESFTTLASAKMWLTDAAEWRFDHPSFPPHAVAEVAAAVAAKNGTTPEAEIDAAKTRAAKRR